MMLGRAIVHGSELQRVAYVSTAYVAGEVEDAAGALDIDRARLLDREVEGDGGGAVDDGPHARGDLVVAVAEPQARSGQVPGDGDGATRRGRLHAVQHGAKARIGLGVVGGADEAMDLVVGRQQAGEHGHADEACGSGEQDRTFGDGHGFRYSSFSYRASRVACRPDQGHGQPARTRGACAGPPVERAPQACVPSPLWALPAVEMLKRG